MGIPEPALAEAPPRGVNPPRPRGATITPMKSRGVVTQPEHRHRSRDVLPFLLEHDILSVKNIDNVAHEFRWDRRRYLIRQGETGYVPFPAMVNAMGDPRSMDGEKVKFRTDDGTSGIVDTRHETLCALFARYAVENYDIDALVEFAPKLEVTTMEGDPVIFPAQDPGMIAYPVPQSVEPGKENSDQRRLMDRLNAENADMRAELAEMRELISERLGGASSSDLPDPEEPEDPDDPEDPDGLAAALSGATLDTGPATRLH